MTNSDSYNNDQLEEVWTWLHDEKRCVTTQTVSLTMGLPRTVAAALLQNVVKYKDNSDKYEVTKCCLVKEDNKTIVKLVKSEITPDTDIDTADGPIYSLSLQSGGYAPSLKVAHQQDMTEFREKLDTNIGQVLDNIAPSILPSIVKEISRLDLEQSREQRGTVAAARSATSGVSSHATKMMQGGGKRKATSAASFFQNKKSSSSSTSSNKQKSDSSSTAAKAAASKPKATSSTSSSKSATKSTALKKAAVKKDKLNDDNDDKEDTNVPNHVPEKENDLNSSADSSGKEQNKPTAVGNADDFVGDEDEDEEFLAEEEERKRRVEASEKKEAAKKQRAAPARRRVVLEDDDGDEEGGEEEEQTKVKGAMDAFATVVKSPPKDEAPTHHKRRKVLKEKTTMDDAGYLHTEMVTVWEDVPTDEDEAEAAATPAARKKAPVKNTKNMKQGSLMGFFQKKK